MRCQALCKPRCRADYRPGSCSQTPKHPGALPHREPDASQRPEAQSLPSRPPGHTWRPTPPSSSAGSASAAGVLCPVRWSNSQEETRFSHVSTVKGLQHRSLHASNLILQQRRDQNISEISRYTPASQMYRPGSAIDAAKPSDSSSCFSLYATPLVPGAGHTVPCEGGKPSQYHPRTQEPEAQRPPLPTLHSGTPS